MLYCIEDNEAFAVGAVCSPLSYSHEVHGEQFYRFMMRTERLSENADLICVTLSEKLLPETSIEIGKRLTVCGQFRSYNNYSGVGNKLVLTLFAKEINADLLERLHRLCSGKFSCKFLLQFCNVL